MPKRDLVIPTFRSEKEEAAWWDKHRTEVEAGLRQAMRKGTAKTLANMLAERKKRALQPITIRLDTDDIAAARKLAAGAGIGYQTYIKLLLHDALQREAANRARSLRR